ncbi:MAG: 2-succinyl-6-hydroxy-2,4-cyclohexadiene-1-carboxylate synthase [Melioribacteraceae bacterium]
MIIKIEDIKFFVKRNPNATNQKPVVFLHGFSGSSLDWKFLISELSNEFESITIDLLGHGKTSSPKNIGKYSCESQVQLLDDLFKKLNIVKPILVGYSMGGRLALSYLLNHPNKVEAIVLESTSFGLKKKTEKEERKKSDGVLASKIINSTLEEFIDYWTDIPLFDSQKNLPLTILTKQRENKTSTNNVLGLSNSLLGFGTGKMDNYFNELEKIKIMVLLITGRLDSKFTRISKDVNSLLSNSSHIIMDGTGHNVHLEKPEEFLKFLNVFLLKSIKN